MIKSRKLGIGLLLLLAMVVTTGSFAYWASGVTGDSDAVSATVTIGSGEALTTTITVADLSSTLGLVPTDYVGGTDVDRVVFTSSVLWEEDTTGASGITGDLTVDLDSFTLGNLDESVIDDMFSITVTSGPGNITEGIAKDVVITIIFHTEPDTEAIYDQVANGTLAMTFTYEVTPD